MKMEMSRGCPKTMNFRFKGKGHPLSFNKKIFNYHKTGTGDYLSNASFVILWAIDSSPHSIFTFSFPRSKKRRNDQQPLIRPKVCSTSTTLWERSFRPISEQRFSFAFFFNSFKRCENRKVFAFSVFLHSSA